MLARLLSECAGPEVRGVALSGSHARGQADAFSDVDLVCYVPQALPRSGWLGHREGRLVSVDRQHIEDRLANLRHPVEALHAVLPLRRLRVLLDRDGALSALRQAALAFRWDSLQAAAQARSGELVAHQAEVVHKLMGGLSAGDDSRSLAALNELVQELAVALALLRGVLLDSGNTFFAQVWQAAGSGSPWTRTHRRAAGVDEAITLNERGEAGLALYIHTVALVEPVMSDEHR